MVYIRDGERRLEPALASGRRGEPLLGAGFSVILIGTAISMGVEFAGVAQAQITGANL
jgi:hypothetical protein